MDKKPILFNTEMVEAILEGRKTVTRRVIKPRNPIIANQEGYKQGYGLWIDPSTDNGDKQGHIKDYSISPLWSTWKWYIKHYAPYQVGNILYVRETWRPIVGKMHTMSRDGKRIVYTSDDHNGYEYKAHCLGVSDFYFPDGFKESEDYEHMSEITSKGKWHPSIHMPKEATRIFLKVTDVRVERLQDMTEDDVCSEGAENLICSCEHMDYSVVPPEPCFNTYSACKDCIIDHSYQELFGRQIWDSTIKKNDLDRYGWEANPWVWVIEFERNTKRKGTPIEGNNESYNCEDWIP